MSGTPTLWSDRRESLIRPLNEQERCFCFQERIKNIQTVRTSAETKFQLPLLAERRRGYANVDHSGSGAPTLSAA